MATETTIQKLRGQLGSIRQSLANLISEIPVEWFNRRGGGLVIVGAPDYHFQKPGPPQVRRQAALHADYVDWFERFSLLFREPPSDLRDRVAEADRAVRNWIELGTNWNIGPDKQSNSKASAAAFQPLFELLDLFDGPGRVVLVPDTNALLAVADVRRFRSVAKVPSFDLVLLPTVLSELDNLKIFARDPAFRAKVAKTIRRIKGWRRQGSLHSGLTLHKNIKIRAVAREPRMSDSLSWLDSSNRDDRVIASMLELQAAEPSSSVLLVTSDINMQNKAEAASLPFSEVP